MIRFTITIFNVGPFIAIKGEADTLINNLPTETEKKILEELKEQFTIIQKKYIPDSDTVRHEIFNRDI